MIAPIVIRPVIPSDVSAVRRLRIEALRLHPVAFSADLAAAEARPAEAWRRQVEDAGGAGGGVIMVAEPGGGGGGEPAGMAGVYTPAEPKLKHCGVVWGVYVRAPFRGRGVGRRLVTACIDWARGKGWSG